jgi:hypothetical protein
MWSIPQLISTSGGMTTSRVPGVIGIVSAVIGLEANDPPRNVSEPSATAVLVGRFPGVDGPASSRRGSAALAAVTPR